MEKYMMRKKKKGFIIIMCGQSFHYGLNMHEKLQKHKKYENRKYHQVSRENKIDQNFK